MLHDIGNPPFGHFGESAIRNWFKQKLDTIKYRRKTLGEMLDDQQKYDLYNFEGNVQALRVIAKLHQLNDPSRNADFDPYKTAVFTRVTMKQLFCVVKVSETLVDHYCEIMSGQFKDELIVKISEGRLVDNLKKICFSKNIHHFSILKIELMGNEVIVFLLDRFVDA